MNYICPTLGHDHEKDFLVIGKIDDFKIIVFSDLENYFEGFEYLKLSDYEPCEVNVIKNIILKYYQKMMMNFQV